MTTIDESIAEIKTHLKKLSMAISSEASFTFLDVKIYNKLRIDDLLCCVEACFPNEYKKLIRVPKNKKYRSIEMYYALKSVIQRRLPFSSSSYMIQWQAALSQLTSFAIFLEKDIIKLYKEL